MFTFFTFTLIAYMHFALTWWDKRFERIRCSWCAATHRSVLAHKRHQDGSESPLWRNFYELQRSVQVSLDSTKVIFLFDSDCANDFFHSFIWESKVLCRISAVDYDAFVSLIQADLNSTKNKHTSISTFLKTRISKRIFQIFLFEV